MYSIKTCLSCPRIAKTRGVCINCYGKLHDLIKAGEKTWEQLEQDGRCLAAKSRHERNNLMSRTLRLHGRQK